VNLAPLLDEKLHATGLTLVLLVKTMARNAGIALQGKPLLVMQRPMSLRLLETVLAAVLIWCITFLIFRAAKNFFGAR
jgi:hypothetical protein